jgi:predicted methyltransferase
VFCYAPISSTMAKWTAVRENLLPNHCVVIHDYSENYGCKEKFELQQTYFQSTEVSKDARKQFWAGSLSQSVATVMSVRCSYTWYISLSSSEILGKVYFY